MIHDEDFKEWERVIGSYKEKKLDAVTKIQNLLKMICESSLYPMVLWGFEDSKFIYVSESFAALLGYSQYELVMTDWWELIHPDDHKKSAEEYHTNKTEGRHMIKNFTNRYRHAEGHYIELKWLQGINDFDLGFGVSQVIAK